MNKSPAFLWYPKDILASARVAEMSLAEECAYRRLLDYCWLHGSVPADAKRAARVVGKGCTPEIAEIALTMFELDIANPDRMIHDRLEAERAKQESNSKARQAAAEARWNKNGKAINANGTPAKSTSNANALQMQSIPIAISNANTKENSQEDKSSMREPAPKPPAKSKAHPLSTHPAIQAIKTVTGRYPKKEIYEKVIELLGEQVDINKLAEIFSTWVGRGWNQNNLLGIIDAYLNGGVKENAARNGNIREFKPKPNNADVAAEWHDLIEKSGGFGAIGG